MFFTYSNLAVSKNADPNLFLAALFSANSMSLILELGRSSNARESR